MRLWRVLDSFREKEAPRQFDVFGCSENVADELAESVGHIVEKNLREQLLREVWEKGYAPLELHIEKIPNTIWVGIEYRATMLAIKREWEQ